MRTLKYRDWNLLIPFAMKDDEAKLIFDTITDHQFDDLTTLKNDKRSLVKKILINGITAVLKVPTEANNRLIFKLRTLYRQSEVSRSLRDMLKLIDLGFKTTIPIMAAEFYNNGVVTDSWILYHYLDGSSCLGRSDTYSKVVQTLSSLHEKGYLHGDPQIRNFLTNQNGDEIYIIDPLLKKSGLMQKNEEAYEWVYLEKSDPEIGKFIPAKNSWRYKLAKKYDRFDRDMATQRRRIKRFLGLRKA